jgi:hypothetical protein
MEPIWWQDQDSGKLTELKDGRRAAHSVPKTKEGPSGSRLADLLIYAGQLPKHGEARQAAIPEQLAHFARCAGYRHLTTHGSVASPLAIFIESHLGRSQLIIAHGLARLPNEA